MILNDIIKKIAQEQELEESNVKKVASKIFEGIIDALKSEEEVRISGFGKFFIRQSKERQGVNPRTREKITIPAKKRVKFWPFGSLRTL